MSLLPMLFSDWWEDLERPHRVLHQNFGLALNEEDLPTTLALRPYYDTDFAVLRPRRRGYDRYRPYERSLIRKSNDGVSMVKANKDKFQVTLDVQQFAPDEISVKVVGKNVVIEGKHEEKQDEHGWISRQFVRKYLVPEQCDIEELKSSLSSDGVLTIVAPRKKQDPQEKEERIIKIQNTGLPAVREDTLVEDKREEQQARKNSAQQRGKDKTVTAA